MELPDFLYSRTTWIILLAVIISGIFLAVLLTIWIIWRVRKIHLPDGAGFIDALQFTPISVVILLDVLDLSLDFLAAPFAWTLLSYLGLAPLRFVSVIESLIPGTQFIPTMTLSWLAVRLMTRKTIR